MVVLGQQLIFTVAFAGDDGDELAVTGPDGSVREVTPPWRGEDAARFAAARLAFRERTRGAVTTGGEHAELTRRGERPGKPGPRLRPPGRGGEGDRLPGEAARRIVEEIKDPRIVGIVSAQLEKLRGGSASK